MRTAAGAADFDVNVEDTFKPLCPYHRRSPLCGCWRLIDHPDRVALAPPGRRHQCPVLAVGRDKIARSDFEQLQAGPKGEGQDARNNTPWNRVRFTLGFGTSAASLAMAAPAHPCARSIHYILYIKSSGSKMTCVVPSLSGMHFTLEINDKKFMSSLSNQEITIPAFSDAVVDATRTTTLFGIARQVQGLQGSTRSSFAYRLSGNISIRDQAFSLPFDITDTFNFE